MLDKLTRAVLIVAVVLWAVATGCIMGRLAGYQDGYQAGASDVEYCYESGASGHYGTIDGAIRCIYE